MTVKYRHVSWSTELKINNSNIVVARSTLCYESPPLVCILFPAFVFQQTFNFQATGINWNDIWMYCFKIYCFKMSFMLLFLWGFYELSNWFGLCICLKRFWLCFCNLCTDIWILGSVICHGIFLAWILECFLIWGCHYLSTMLPVYMV